MTWRERAGPGSFRGVKFQADLTNVGGGRKTVVHEYPLRDDTFVEDLGRRGQSISVDAYLVGDDYIEQRDALLEALQRAGPGRLSLPYMEVETLSFMVSAWSLSNAREEGGIERISIEFLETSEQLFPIDLPDVSAALDADLASALDSIQENFLSKYDIADAPGFTFASLSSVVASAGQSLRDAFAPVSGFVNGVTGAVDSATQFAADIKRQVDSIILDADALVRSPFEVVDRFRDLFEAVFESPALPPRNLDALLEAYEFTPDIPSPSPITATRTTEAANYVALQSMIQCMTVVAATNFAPRTEFESYEQAVDARDRITDLIDEQMDVAADTVFEALNELRASLVKAVPGLDSDLPRLLSFTPPVTLPSLVIAHRLYGNVDSELELVARNRIRHPGFVTGGRALEVLSDA